MNDIRDPVLKLEEIGLCYRLAKHRVSSFKEYTIHLVRGTLRYEKLWALQDVSFSVQRGSSVGIIGRNGAGKSSLLKVISKVLKPTKGKLSVHGRVSPILGLGTGFDHELTGVENIYLNAMLLGHRRREIDARVDAIADFSGLGHLIDSPLRHYSSGMLARLGFSVATAWRPDILLLDEVLAVGDARFVKRCHEKLQEFLAAGTTVLMVSHSVESIAASCTRALWLEDGRLTAVGEPRAVISEYLGSLETKTAV